MKLPLVLIGLTLVATPAMAKKSCDELKAEIEAKITAKGVKHFSLTVTPKDAPDEGKVVATCDGGKSKILYKRESKKS